MNSTSNGSSCSSQLNPAAEQIGKALAYCLILVVSLFGNSLFAIIVYRTQTLRKPVNFFTFNMAMSDLLYSIFCIPCTLAGLYLDSWLISGLLGQALCKLYFILSTVSSFVSIQSLILRALDSGFSPPSRTHQLKAVSPLDSRHLDRNVGCLLAIFFHH